MATTTLRDSIRARGLHKSFGEVVAVDGLDLDAAPGRCLGILGPNGAGKTTTVEMLEGLCRPERGTIEILGRTWQKNARELRGLIGVQLQETLLPDKLRVAEVLRLFRSLYAKGRGVNEVLELIGLEEKRSAFVVELSGGQRQRLSLGCALVHRPEILFLDEPTTGLDPSGRRTVWEVVERFKAEGGSVVLTTHFMEEAERLADELMILDHGRCLLRGTPREIVASLGAESILEISFNSPTSIPETELAQLPGALSATSSPGHVRLGAKSFELLLPAALGLLARHQLAPTDLEMHRPTLDDVFVSLTGRELREA